ncbi:hypothetical protein F5Y16DRAFT_375592 [Xylariaceae sp. FL0255]|nr:hypothetical protein F5Y16DRAFT_375592 [Xylariaceae sp. FL0255]
MSQQQQQQNTGPPYAPKYASPGGRPDVLPDIPISAVFLVIYLGFAVTNMTIFQLNNRRQHKFVFSGLLFGFCMSRIVAFTLRIVWAKYRNNVSLALAATVFVNAGVLILYILNLVFAQRMLRALQPRIGWHRSISIALKIFYAGIGIGLALIIYSIIQTAYTKDLALLDAARKIQLGVSTYLLVFTTIPFWLLLTAHVLLPKSEDAEVFGHGTMRTKLIILCCTTAIAIFIAGFKTGTAYMPPRLVTDPAWYQSKPAFYVFQFVLEIFILSLFTISRVDKRFHIPNGSKGPGDYSRGHNEEEKDERSGSDGNDGGGSV